MQTASATTQLSALRDAITKSYRMDETTCVNQLIPQASLPEASLEHIQAVATQLVSTTRAYKKREGKIDSLLHKYDLSSEEGIALMCMAEALLRIPDKATMQKFISDKLSTVAWSEHLGQDDSLFLNAATWSLLLAGKVYGPTLDQSKS